MTRLDDAMQVCRPLPGFPNVLLDGPYSTPAANWQVWTPLGVVKKLQSHCKHVHVTLRVKRSLTCDCR